MTNNLSEFFLADRTLWQINRHIRRDVKAAHLAKTITKLMHDTFSKITLAQLDKRILIHGYSKKFEIPAISGIAVNDLLGREINPVLDEQMLYDAWQLVYQHGVCPCENRYQ